jgi:hypothetical protein
MLRTKRRTARNETVSPRQLQRAPPIPPLHLASISKHERRQVEISSFHAMSPTSHTVPLVKEGLVMKSVISTTAFTDGVTARIGLDQFFEAEGFIFDK